ncbi:unnamed protein product [Polarella glacialis]|uniref:Phospholipase/carboxylesterase/thioesterase domain-containing protein n=2 Tax=Polarella glacialis TaxID=89957 RepID=A0A813GDB3_POLGL|nr:unnamed protein product [Polarella glacialis]
MGPPVTEPAQFGKPLVFGPEVGDGCDAAVLWLHGFGDAPSGWASALRALRLRTPRWRWLHLRAPRVKQPCYGNQAVPAWGQFVSQDCIHVGGKDYEDPDTAGIYARSVAAVHAELDMPMLVCHGTADDMVGFDCAEAAVSALGQAGLKVQFERFEGLKHSSSPKLLAELSDFVRTLLPCDDNIPSVGEDDADSEEREGELAGCGGIGMAGVVGDYSGRFGNIPLICGAASLGSSSKPAHDGLPVSKDAMQELVDPSELPDLEVMVAACSSALRDIMDEGWKGYEGSYLTVVGKFFVEAAEAFKERSEQLPDAERPAAEMTARDFRAAMEESRFRRTFLKDFSNDSCGNEEGEEEELSDDEEEDDEGTSEDLDGQPQKKVARLTSRGSAHGRE